MITKERDLTRKLVKKQPEPDSYNWQKSVLGGSQIFVSSIYSNNYSDLHHSQVGMKFATQISPLLNFYFGDS